MRFISENTYRKNIRENITLLDETMESGEYPHLTELLCSHGKSLYRKLKSLLEYFDKYGHDIKQRMSYHDKRGWEMMASYDVMSTLGAGMDKATWEKAVLKLCTLQLLKPFRPRTDEEYRQLNTSVQQLSADRAEKDKRKPVTWYHVPKYTKSVLKQAEALAPFVKAGAAVNKDSIRDVLGADLANKATDTGWDIHPDTKDRRNTLKWMLIVKLRLDGYATSKNVVCEAMEFDSYKGYSYSRWFETWNGYKGELLRELHLKKSRPTKAEKERWKLNSDEHIIRSDGVI